MLGTLFRHWQRMFAIGAVALTLPVSTFAATPEMLPTVKDAQLVTRRAFLRASMDALGVRRESVAPKMPFARVPSDLRAYVGTAWQLGYLRVFGTGGELYLGRTITRGEAVQLVAAIEGLQPTRDFKSVYRDARPFSPLGRAVSVATERKWMPALSDKVFGVKNPLTGKDARAFLLAVLKEEESRGTKIRIPVINIKPAELPKEQLQRKVWEILQDQYLYPDKLKDENAGNGSIQGMVKSVDDPYTSFLPPVESHNLQSQLQGEVEGIGARVEMSPDGKLTITSPIPGSPAEKAGLQAGDQILRVNDESLVGLSLDEAVGKVRGPRGSIAKLRILRNGSEMDVEVTRDKITFKDVQSRMENQIAVVQIVQFGQPTLDTFDDTLKQILANNPKGLILDLRNDPGGYLTAADKVVSAFLPKGSTYVRIHTRDAVMDERTNDEPFVPTTLPVAVLVNKNSASASEIVAGTLQDVKRAIIVGENSFGKGTVQQIFNFTDGSSLKVTTAEFRTPSDKKINGVGVKPDYEVPASDKEADGDVQLTTAINLLLR